MIWLELVGRLKLGRRLSEMVSRRADSATVCWLRSIGSLSDFRLSRRTKATKPGHAPCGGRGETQLPLASELVAAVELQKLFERVRPDVVRG